MGLLERYLSLWVGLCIPVDVFLGNLLPHIFAVISRLEFSHVHLVIAVAYIAGDQLTRLQLALTSFLFIAALAWEIMNIVTTGIAAKLKLVQLAEFGVMLPEGPDTPRFGYWLFCGRLEWSPR